MKIVINWGEMCLTCEKWDNPIQVFESLEMFLKAHFDTREDRIIHVTDIKPKQKHVKLEYYRTCDNDTIIHGDHYYRDEFVHIDKCRRRVLICDYYLQRLFDERPDNLYFYQYKRK